VVNEDTDSDGLDLTCVANCVGNISFDSSVTVRRDATPPEVSLVGGPEDGASYHFGFVPDAPTCTANEVTSGLDGECSVSGYSELVGVHSVAAVAQDLAGNSATTLVSYTVLPWTLNGFLQPVDMGEYNRAKAGSTVPLKFQIFAGPTELTDVADVAGFDHAQITCDTAVPTEDIEETTTGGTSLRYDDADGQFVYNWQTPNNAGSCYRVTMTTLDGSTLTAEFKLK
jgi:hypothetical protein